MPTRVDLLLISCLHWRSQKELHPLILVLSSLVGSSFLRFAYVVAGAVMLRMLRCVSLSSLRLCGVHVVGGCCIRMPTVGFGLVCLVLLVAALYALSCLLFLSSASHSLSFSSPPPLSLSLSFSLPQPVESHTT